MTAHTETERDRVERVVQILADAAGLMEGGRQIPLDVLSDAVTFVSCSEEAAYDAMKADEDEPALSRCLDQHAAVRRPLTTMLMSLEALAGGNRSATAQFVQAVQEYVTLRIEHFRLDDRVLVAPRRHSPVLDGPDTPVEFLETTVMRRLYDQVIEAAGVLGISGSGVRRSAKSGT
jgi:hemerythrin-like domain-containing protein